MFNRTETEVNWPSLESKWRCEPESKLAQASSSLLSGLSSHSQKHSRNIILVWGCVENSPFKEFKELVVEEILSKGDHFDVIFPEHCSSKWGLNLKAETPPRASLEDTPPPPRASASPSGRPEAKEQPCPIMVENSPFSSLRRIWPHLLPPLGVSLSKRNFSFDAETQTQGRGLAPGPISTERPGFGFQLCEQWWWSLVPLAVWSEDSLCPTGGHYWTCVGLNAFLLS